MRRVLAWCQRVLAIVGKDTIEVVRRPGALASLVVGPFLIMAIFGYGYRGAYRPLDTIVVVPPGSAAPTDAASYQAMTGGGLRFVGVVPDRETADAALAARQVDLVVEAPADPEGAFLAGRQSVIAVRMDSADPTRISQVGILADHLSSVVNQQILRQAAARAEAGLGDASTATSHIPPDVIAAPTTVAVTDLAPSTPGVVGFYGPAVLALILQHVAASLIALSLIRERTIGMFERFRVSPVGASEILVGKGLAVGILSLLVAAATYALLTLGLQVPMLGDPVILALVVVLFVIASMSLGLVLALFSDSDRQAVQLSLLLLLASVFFGGLIIAIDEFSPPVQVATALLPVSHGTRLIEDLMLRGSIPNPWPIVALAAMAVFWGGLAWIRLRHELRRA
jgi:ABC-2 type transport system permease protein